MDIKTTILLSASILGSAIIIASALIYSAPKFQIIDGGSNLGRPAKVINVKTGEVFTHINGREWLSKRQPE